MFAVRRQPEEGEKQPEKWDSRAEAYLLECIAKNPPHGMHKHFNVLSISIGLRKYCGYEYTIEDVTDKLAQFYDLTYHEDVTYGVQPIVEDEFAEFELPEGLMGTAPAGTAADKVGEPAA